MVQAASENRQRDKVEQRGQNYGANRGLDIGL